ncbi:hypothetical protein [Nocardia lijiangensis]|uniref:hypothetical protein n=1 Tax=Nocardia lijiangensis TaxID=299618 RepID=UPI003D757DEA
MIEIPEAFVRIKSAEFRGVIADGDALDMEVHRFRVIYNTIRPHQAIDDQVPSSAFTAASSRKPLDTRHLRMLLADCSQPVNFVALHHRQLHAFDSWKDS